MGFKLPCFCVSDFMCASSLLELQFSHLQNYNNTYVICFIVIMNSKDNAFDST